MLTFKRDIPQREADLQANVTRALDQMIFHQRVAEMLQEFAFMPVAGPFLKRQADHHLQMAQAHRELAGNLWTMWQDEIKAREALLAECEGVANAAFNR